MDKVKAALAVYVSAGDHATSDVQAHFEAGWRAAIREAASICRSHHEHPYQPTVMGPNGDDKTTYHLAGQEMAAIRCARDIEKL